MSEIGIFRQLPIEVPLVTWTPKAVLLWMVALVMARGMGWHTSDPIC
jgi:hypothetical protein